MLDRHCPCTWNRKNAWTGRTSLKGGVNESSLVGESEKKWHSRVREVESRLRGACLSSQPRLEMPNVVPIPMWVGFH